MNKLHAFRINLFLSYSLVFIFLHFSFSCTEIVVTKNNILARIPRFSAEWSISFQFRQTSQYSGWINLIHFAVSGTVDSITDPVVTGERIPAVFINSGGTLHVSNEVNGYPNYYSTAGYQINLNESYLIEINQRYVSRGDYRYFYKINGKEIHSVINSDAKQFYNVNVYASDPWYEANGFISNFQFTNFL